MNTEMLLRELERRGLQLVVVDGNIRLRGPKHEATPSLLRVLRWHRDEIRERLLASGPREWRWRDGHTYLEVDGEWKDEWLVGYSDRHPAGAWWWRHVGQARWQPIAGRTPEEAREVKAA